MFGLGKKKSAPADKPAKKASSASSGGSAVWKQFFVYHGEKLAAILLISYAGYLIYNGLVIPHYDSQRSPELLTTAASNIKNKIETENRWTEIKDDEERKPSGDFRKAVKDARTAATSQPYNLDHIVQRGAPVSAEKRGDPELFAPRAVRGECFVGSIAVFSRTKAGIDSWLNAPPMQDGRKKREVPSVTTPVRTLAPEYDLGFKYAPGMPPPIPLPAPIAGPGKRAIEYRVRSQWAAINIVTAVVPHGEMIESYKKELALFYPGRDTPNYLNYEVQRVDVTNNPDRPIDESEWKDAPECMFERQLQERATWVGYCNDPVKESFIVKDVLTMPIPPILLTDYKRLVTHPDLPQDWSGTTSSGEEESEEVEDSAEMSEDSEGNSTVGPDPLSVIVQPIPAPPAIPVEPPEPISITLPPTPVKLIRFFDFIGLEGLGKVYRYRIRVALEDPNYPRSKSLSVSTINLKPEVLERVRVLENAEFEALQNLPPGQTYVRNSKRYTPWSEPSTPILANLPVFVRGSQVTGNWVIAKNAAQKEVVLETRIPESSVIYGEWTKDEALLVTKKVTKVERGSLLSAGPVEPGIDVIHPILKTIKWMTGFKFSRPVTVADIRGGQKLTAEKSRPADRDALPAQGEIVVYDPKTGELIISREFEASTDFDMYSLSTYAAPTAAEKLQP